MTQRFKCQDGGRDTSSKKKVEAQVYRPQGQEKGRFAFFASAPSWLPPPLAASVSNVFNAWSWGNKVKNKE
jgi:hypothetical protein